ncbi:fam-l protein [Plasmodium malariae]|uniref:Fam-l protein n=1 Tax=Plasmodium malariae TaxID=5858 RepID=A0A1D3JHK0_PLAMA|nr:fam-l protein [Plasmodium malariae]SBT85722.1 fam-l protein [Plasmodium malariae]
MEEKIKLMFLTKIVAFILLTCIRDNRDLAWFNIMQSEKFNHNRKLQEKTCLSLTKYNQDNSSCIVGLNEEISRSGKDVRTHMYNNEVDKVSKKQLNKSSMNNKRGHKNDKKNKSCIFETKKYSRLEKKIFKELDFSNFLRSNRTISNKLYKKITLKKYGLRIVIPLLLFLLLLISLILDLSGSYGIINVLSTKMKTLGSNVWKTFGQNFGYLIGKTLGDYLRPLFTEPSWASTSDPAKVFATTGLFGFIVYIIPFMILGVTFISWIIYYHRKVKKYEKIKFRRR